MSVTLRKGFVRAFAGGGSSVGLTTPTMEAITAQLALKGMTCEPALASVAVTCATGVVQLVKFRAWAASIASVVVNVTTAQVGATNAYVSIFNADGTQSAAMATSTVDAAATLGATGVKTINLTNAVALTIGSDYYVAILVTGAPSTALQVSGSVSTLANAQLAAATGFRSGNSGAGLAAMPASITLATMGAQARMIWAGVL